MSEKSDLTIMFLAVMALVSLAAGIVSGATVTQSITYQGKLTDAAGNPLTGTYSVTFRIYTAGTGGTVVSTDTHNVIAANGLFTTSIAVTDPAAVNGQALWLGIKVGSDPEMTPRQEIRPVPYADSLRPGAWVTGTDTSSTVNLRNTGGGMALNASTNVASSTAISGKAEGSSSAGVAGESTNYAGIYGKGVWGGMFKTNQAGSGGFIPVGIWVDAPYANNKGLGATVEGPNSPAVYAYSTGKGSYGVYAETTNGTTVAVYGKTSGGASEAVYGESAQYVGVRGKGVTGGRFETNQAGHDLFIPIAAYVYAPYDNNKGLVVSTTGATSPAITASATGLNSSGIDVTTIGANSDGVIVWTKGYDSEGVFVRTEGDTSQGVWVETSGFYSDGMVVRTHGHDSEGVWAETHGANSKGVYSETYDYYSEGVVTRTHGADSEGVWASSDQSTGIYAETNRGDNKYGVRTPDIIRALGYETGASDVAEYMPVIGDVEPGTVLIIGADRSLEESSMAYDTRVAGILSKAPGVSLGAKEGGNPGEELIAISGRVPCRVDATRVPIHAGDLLTTSDTPGHAMKAEPTMINGRGFYPDGTILGKAMESLESGTGMIEVLVTLQ